MTVGRAVSAALASSRRPKSIATARLRRVRSEADGAGAEEVEPGEKISGACARRPPERNAARRIAGIVGTVPAAERGAPRRGVLVSRAFIGAFHRRD